MSKSQYSEATRKAMKSRSYSVDISIDGAPFTHYQVAGHLDKVLGGSTSHIRSQAVHPGMNVGDVVEIKRQWKNLFCHFKFKRTR